MTSYYELICRPFINMWKMRINLICGNNPKVSNEILANELVNNIEKIKS